MSLCYSLVCLLPLWHNLVRLLPAGVVNYLAYVEQPTYATHGYSIRMVKNGQVVFNINVLATIARQAFQLNSNHDLVSPSSWRVYPVIHQYDRHPKIVEVVKQKYPFLADGAIIPALPTLPPA